MAKLRWKRKGSIGGKLIFICFLLVFIALAIVGVFILQQLEAYHLDVVRSNSTKPFDQNALQRLDEYAPLKDYKQEIQSNIDTWYMAIQEEILVIDESLYIVASSNPNLMGKNAIESLDSELIVKGLNGEIAESETVIVDQNIPVLNIVFPIESNEGINGVLYVRSDLTNIYDTMNQVKIIFAQGMAIALIVAIILGALLSRSISKPINEVTRKADILAEGDFSQKVQIKSADEIGRLGMVFNQMGERLEKTLSEISEEKNKLEIILKTMADGLIAADQNGNIIHFNPAFLQMLDLDEKQVLNQSYDKVIQPICGDLSMKKVRKKDVQDWEGIEIFEKEGFIFYARYVMFPKSKTTEIGFILMIQDITERQKLESMQRDFVANVSHELNTPLTTIKSYTETLLDDPELKEQVDLTKQFLTVIDSEADRMSRLVKDLLQLSRLEYQTEKWDKKPCNLVKLVQNVVMKMQINAYHKSQHLNQLFSLDDTMMIYADEDKMEQVLVNILGNAIKYTEENGRIDIDLIRWAGEIQLIIMDNGIGISEKELPRLFERFYRVDKARSRSMGGTGLGLSIAKQIVEEHGGRIDIESKEGKGTTVTIIFQLEE